jgi:phosphoribosylformylglycinamidine cyclo-ligase
MRSVLQTVEWMVRTTVFHVADRITGMANKYAEAGVDTAAGDLAVELMKSAVSATHGPSVVGGFGGFAGLFDVSVLKDFDRPLLATSTDGVGTKVAIAQALDKHDTIGQDLVGMVVDDIIVVGAKPIFMTDYIACGRVVPERIADIVRGIAEACAATGTALVGGETAEHPGLLGPDDYDVAGAAVGVVDASALLGPERVQHGDVVIAMESSGLHSNGFSLVRHILAGADIGYTDSLAELGVVGEALLVPTRLYTSPLVALLDEVPGAVHSLSHVTGGGIAANLARVLPVGSWVQLDRASWSPPAVFRVLSDLGTMRLEEAEGTWNLGIGMIAVVNKNDADAVAASLRSHGIENWVAGIVSTAPLPEGEFEQGAKGVNGGSVSLVGAYRS